MSGFLRGMPLFKPKASPRSSGSEKPASTNGSHHEGHDTSSNGTSRRDNGQEHQTPASGNQDAKQRLVFRCQLAHGSSTGQISGFSNVRELYQKIAECYELPANEISGFSNVRELYQKIAECYELPANEILFCTLNTPKAEMSELLGGQIGLDDFIFAHRKGQPKEVELVKTDDALGLTITDNGAGYAFIKRIKEGSVIDKVNVIQVGDHIEKINTVNLVGRRHFEVAKMLKEISKGDTFTLRLVEPQRSGFGSIGPRGDIKKGKKPAGYGTGKETLRFRADGSAQIEKVTDNTATIGVEKINAILENFMGINDNELASQIWELAEGKTNSMDFAEAIDNSDLEAFGFTDDFVIELWGAVTDARSGRHR